MVGQTMRLEPNSRSGSNGRSTVLDQPNLGNHVVSGVEQRRQGVFTLTKLFLCRDCAPETRARHGDELC
jgi:hypothetical protein